MNNNEKVFESKMDGLNNDHDSKYCFCVLW